MGEQKFVLYEQYTQQSAESAPDRLADVHNETLTPSGTNDQREPSDAEPERTLGKCLPD
jgi:hypothetical protein